MANILDIHATIDEMLADFPPAARMKASANILTALLRMKRETDQAITDREAARLLPLGADTVAMRQGCHRVTAYRRARRSIVALLSPSATTS
jgi:hypothetical protein